MKSGNLNFLEPSGSLQACNGTAFILQKFKHPCLIYVAEMQTYDKTIIRNSIFKH
jgi:hypothetical protein